MKSRVENISGESWNIVAIEAEDNQKEAFEPKDKEKMCEVKQRVVQHLKVR